MTGSGSITGVTGGTAGLAAAYDAVRGLADAFDLAGSELRDWAALGVRTMTDPDLAASAPLSPVTFGLAEMAVLAATTGRTACSPARCAGRPMPCWSAGWSPGSR